MIIEKKLHKLSLCVVAACGLVAAPQLMAQEADSNDNAENKTAERIQVVGSRIRTDAFGNDNPIDIISVEDAENEGLSTLGQLLRTSTAASGSSQITAAMTVGFVQDGGTGTETVSLRGLGANRTLVLINGRRTGPSGTRGAVSSVDLNSIPISMVERIEVLKDGASALYGSDAVAGVINVITKKGDSKSVTVDISQPFESGGEDKRFNVSFGEEYADGSFRVTADYRKINMITRGQRDFLECSEPLVFGADGSRRDVINPRTGQYRCDETPFGLWFYGSADAAFGGDLYGTYDYDGYLTENNHLDFNNHPLNTIGFTTPDGWFPVSYTADRESRGLWDVRHPFLNRATLQPEQTVGSLYATGDYNLTDTITLYGEFIHSQRNTKVDSYRQIWSSGAIASNVEGWDGQVFLDPTPLTDHSGAEVDVDYTRAVVGVTGDIGFWTWDLSLQQSHSTGVYKNKIVFSDSLGLSNRKWAGGESCEGTVTPLSNKQCVDIDWTSPDFMYGTVTPEERDFLYGVDVGKTTYKQRTLEGYVTGDLFELPAGEVGTAFGFQIQRDEILDVPGEATLAGNSWGLSASGVTKGSQITRALFAEFRVPLLEGITGVESLDLTASGRYTDVSTYGSDETYKIGLNWQIYDGYSIRIIQGTSFRSPALFELYLADQSSFLSQRQVDVCYDYSARYNAGDLSERIYNNCKAGGVPETYKGDPDGATIFTTGGAGNLTAETSVAKSIGFVWTSPEDTYAFSIDYYDIEIDDEVYSLAGNEAVYGCYNSLDFENEPLCDLFTRRDGTNGNFGVEEVNVGYINISTQTARGVDYNFTFDEEFEFGSVRFEVEHTMQIERFQKLFADTPYNNLIGERGAPKHSGVARLQWSKDDYAITWTANYYDSTNNYEYADSGDNTGLYLQEEITFVDEARWFTYHTVSGSYTYEDFDFILGVANVFDKEPPRVSSRATVEMGNADRYSQYDIRGRRIFANVRYNF